MSTTGLDKKKISFSEGLDSLYEPFPWFTIGDEIENHVPWPEWSDHELNAEVWDESKVKSDLQGEVKIAVPRPSLFEDANPPLLPMTVEDQVASWKRPEEVFRNAKLCVFEPSNQDFKLGIPSKVVNNEFFWHVIEVLPVLQYYARDYGFEVEWETSSFAANTQGEVWRPWHHVYSLCKAGKGQAHKPMHNTFGKYVLRLFYMGAWRRFVVDDRIPCDKLGKCMLPVTQVPGELWPIFLVKALLKVMSLTPTRNFSLIDFPIISFFTGWMKESQNIFKKTKEQIWRRFCAFLPDYEVPERKAIENEISPSKVKEEAGSKKAKEEVSSKKPKDGVASKEVDSKKIKDGVASKEVDSKKGSSKGQPKKMEQFPSKPDFCFVLGVVDGMPDIERSHALCLLTIRTVPLFKATRKEGTKAWKRIRWIYWASKKGLWTDELKLPPYRRVEYITFLREIHKHLTPDPKQEAAIFDIPVEEESVPNDQLSHKSYDPRQWSDFFKMAEFLSALVVYFKPSSFPSGFKVSCMKKNTMRKSGGSSGSGTSGRRNSHFESPRLKPSGNQPPVVYCESTKGIFLQISLSVCPTSTKRTVGYLDENFPEVLTVVKATLAVEKFDWRSPQQGEIIGMGKTVGHSSFSLNLSAGRHILKLWINTDCPFVIHLHSNAELYVSRDLHIRSLMVNESELIINYIEKVSAAFIPLAQSFGKPEYRSALRNFYRAIEPGNLLMIGYLSQLDDFIETFIQSIAVALKDLIPNLDELRITQGALQSLFVDPKITCHLPPNLPPLSIFTNAKRSSPNRKQPPISGRQTLSEILLYRWTEEDIKHLINIQKVYRGYRVRLLLMYHNPNRKEFKPYAERLKKVCDIMFSPSHREEQVGRMLRLVIVAHPNLLETFRFHLDFPKVNAVDMFTGKIPSVEARAWIPIMRFTIASHYDDPLPCSFYFSCNLEQFVVVAINNDTQKELFQLANIVSPYLYENNAKGFTILVYGWNDANVKTVNWRLEMVRMKHFQNPHICNKLVNSFCHRSPIPQFKTIEMRNFYVPNHNSRICRCHIKIQKRCLISLRLSISNPDARFSITISLDKNFGREDAESELEEKLILKKNSLRGAVLLPAVILEYFDPTPLWEEVPDADSNSSTLYILEALVLDNSWGLTKQEWGTVEPLRVSGENWNESSISLSSTKQENRSRKGRSSKKFQNESRTIENPCWLLQVMIDAPEKTDPVEQFVIEEDKSYAEAVRAMKVSWEESDPGRRKKGQELRLNFLRAMYNARRDSVIVGEDEELDSESDGFSVMMRRLSYFSYLTNDDSPARYTKSPRQFPPMPTLDLLGAYKKQSRTVAAKASVGSDLIVPAFKFDASSVHLFSRDRSDYVNNHVRWRLILEDHLREQQNISRQLMDQAYFRRQKVIERLVR